MSTEDNPIEAGLFYRGRGEREGDILYLREVRKGGYGLFTRIDHSWSPREVEPFRDSESYEPISPDDLASELRARKGELSNGWFEAMLWAERVVWERSLSKAV